MEKVKDDLDVVVDDTPLDQVDANINGAGNLKNDTDGSETVNSLGTIVNDGISDEDFKSIYTAEQIEGMKLYVNLSDRLEEENIDIKDILVNIYGSEEQLKAVPLKELMTVVEKEGMKLASKVYNESQINKINDYLNVEVTKKSKDLFENQSYESLAVTTENAINAMKKTSHDNITTHIETTTTIRSSSSRGSSDSSSSETNWLDVALTVATVGLLCYGGYRLYQHFSEEADLIIEAMPDLNMSDALDLADAVLEDSLF